MVIELRVVQFWSEIILVISNRTRTARSFDFEITRMISDQIALHSVQLPLLILTLLTCQQYIAPEFKRPGDVIGSTYRTLDMLEHLNFAVRFIIDIVSQISYARVTCKSSFYL